MKSHVSGGDDRESPSRRADAPAAICWSRLAHRPVVRQRWRRCCKGLPKEFPARIVIVQHVDGAFVAGMVEWLSQESGQRVSVAKEGERPAIGARPRRRRDSAISR